MRVSKLEVVSPHFNLHADQGKWLEEGDDSRSEQDGGANDRWDHVIGTAQSQTRNMGGVDNTVDWNIEVIDLWLGNLPFDCYSYSDFSIHRTCFVAGIVFGNFLMIFHGAVCIMNLLLWNLQISCMFFVIGVGNMAVVTRLLLKVLSTWCSLYGWKNVLYIINFLSVLNFLGLYSINPADSRNRAAASKLV
ncbi:hypothetical protein AHAS_Ahas15G0304400 [Arachis hypogaea]